MAQESFFGMALAKNKIKIENYLGLYIPNLNMHLDR